MFQSNCHCHGDNGHMSPHHETDCPCFGPVSVALLSYCLSTKVNLCLSVCLSVCACQGKAKAPTVRQPTEPKVFRAGVGKYLPKVAAQEGPSSSG